MLAPQPRGVRRCLQVPRVHPPRRSRSSSAWRAATRASASTARARRRGVRVPLRGLLSVAVAVAVLPGSRFLAPPHGRCDHRGAVHSALRTHVGAGPRRAVDLPCPGWVDPTRRLGGAPGEGSSCDAVATARTETAATKTTKPRRSPGALPPDAARLALARATRTLWALCRTHSANVWKIGPALLAVGGRSWVNPTPPPAGVARLLRHRADPNGGPKDS
jgi:hypothetical protein